MEFGYTDEQLEIERAVKAICKRFDADYWRTRGSRRRLSAGLPRRLRAGRLAGHRDARGGGRRRPGHHRGGDHDAHHFGFGRRHVGRLGHPHEHLRAAPGGGERHSRTKAALAAAADRRPAQGLFRRDRAQHRPEHAELKTRAGGAAITMWSMARRYGSRPPRWPTRSCFWRAPPTPDPKAPARGLSLFYTDLDRSRIEVREINKHGRKAVDSNKLFIDDLRIPVEDRCW